MSIEDFPTPWVVGPFGDIWVAADVEFVNGKWREKTSAPRLAVLLDSKNKHLGPVIVEAVNARHSLDAPSTKG